MVILQYLCQDCTFKTTINDRVLLWDQLLHDHLAANPTHVVDIQAIWVEE